MLDWGVAPKLKFKSDFQHLFRDFSGKARVGELAQGVCYGYWMIARGYIWISDFDSWAEDTHVSIPRHSKKPDYVMFNPTSGDIAVMEAKGTSTGRHTAPLGEALRQCRAVLPNVYAKRGYGCALTLDAISAFGRGCLHIRDPENDGEEFDGADHLIFRRSYASWFDISGDRERAELFRKAPVNSTIRRIPVQRFALRKANRMDPLRRAIALAINIDPDRARFWLDEEVWKALHSRSFFTKLNLDRLVSRLGDKGPDEGKTIRFPDGTMISET
jgi:hypothetical protein